MGVVVVVLGICVAVVVVALLWVCFRWMEARSALARNLACSEEVMAARQTALDAQVAALESRFARLAADELVAKQKDLAGFNFQNVGGLFENLKKQLDKYEKEVEAARRATTESALSMTENVNHLKAFASTAERFTAALLGGNKLQGNQGEFILGSILEQSGLRLGREYDTQIGRKDEGGRPDACVYDALNRHAIYIDAKMNIKDFIEAYNLPDDTDEHRRTKKAALAKHATSVRNQIKILAEKRYAETVSPARDGYENLPVVAMFCPFNAVLDAALAEDPSLMQFAAERNVVLVTPTTLWGYLCLVSAGWRRVETEKRYEQIQELGGKVIDKVNDLLGDIEKVALSLKAATDACEQLQKRAGDKGQLSVKRAAKELLDYGCVPKKEPRHVTN